MTAKARVSSLLVLALVTVGLLTWAAVPTSGLAAYTPPCTANTDSCRQQRIVALESQVDGLQARVAALEAGTTTTTTRTPPTTTTTTTTTTEQSTTTTTTPVTTATSPAAGWPDASNTGVPDGTALTVHQGAWTLATAGQVVTGMDIRGCVSVEAANVVIKNSKITGDCWAAVMNDSTGLVIEDSTIIATSGAGIGVGWSDYILRRVEISGGSDGAFANGNVLIEDSWIHGLIATSDSHNDGIQVTSGSNITISHNAIDNALSETSAIMLGADQGSIADITVQGNLLNGGGYTLYGGANPPSGNTIGNIRLTGNHFGRAHWATCGFYGPLAATDDPRIAVSGNVWDDTGAAVQ